MLINDDTKIFCLSNRNNYIGFPSDLKLFLFKLTNCYIQIRPVKNKYSIGKINLVILPFNLNLWLFMLNFWSFKLNIWSQLFVHFQLNSSHLYLIGVTQKSNSSYFTQFNYTFIQFRNHCYLQ